jgi:hypothetical protein
MPDVGKVLKDYDPATFDERQRKALAKVREAGLIDRLTPEPAGRVSAPSPWAKDAAEAEAGLDGAALPSAMAPAAPAEERPVTKRAAPPEGARRRWPATWIVVLGCIGFMLAVGLMSVVVMMGRSTDPKGQAGPGESAAVATAPSAPAAVSASAVQAAAPSVTGVPSATATANATATARGTPAPLVKPPGRRQTASDDPYDAAAPIAPATAPAATAAPSGAPAETPTSTRWF